MIASVPAFASASTAQINAREGASPGRHCSASGPTSGAISSTSPTTAPPVHLRPIIAFEGELNQELPTPAHFEQAAKMVREEDVAQIIPCGPDPERHIAAVRKFVDAGFDHIYVHQIGSDQEGFFRFYEQEVLPKLR
jgi:hypothetical protein